MLILIPSDFSILHFCKFPHMLQIFKNEASKNTFGYVNINLNIMYIIHTDGGSRGNPGPAAIGVVVDEKLSNGDIVNVKKYKEYIGENTNNQAEYMAILWALNFCKTNGYKTLECYLDSELVVKQLNKEYKIKDLGLSKIAAKIFLMLSDFDSCKFIHVRREFNKAADALVNEALDENENL